MTQSRAARHKRVAIVQSNYIPWKGYFDLVALSDEFILYDDAQYTKNDWRNRNRVKTPDGSRWLTIPVRQSGQFGQRIDETLVIDQRWRVGHWKTIVQNYRKAPYFDRYAGELEALYLGAGSDRLSDINHGFITELCRILGIETPIAWSTDYEVTGTGSQRVLELCIAADATEYFSGPSAKSYLEEAVFRERGIAITYADYSRYPEYPQLHPPFDHAVSVIDLLLNVGPNTARHMQFGQQL